MINLCINKRAVLDNKKEYKNILMSNVNSNILSCSTNKFQIKFSFTENLIQNKLMPAQTKNPAKKTGI